MAEIRVNSVANAIHILKFLASSGRPLGVNAIGREVGVSTSSCFNILKTLASEDFLTFDAVTKRYALSPAMSDFFLPSQSLHIYSELIAGYMREVSQKFAVSCGLWEKLGTRVLLRQVSDSPNPTRIHMVVGQRLPSYLGAMGRCISASEDLRRSEVSKLIESLRWENPPSANQYWRGMQLASTQGWATDEGNYIRGVTTIASPIFSPDTSIRYCVTATMFQTQHSGKTKNVIAMQVREIAHKAMNLFRER